MIEESKREGAAATMRRIIQAWLDGRVDDLAPLVHPDIVMVFPGFAGRIGGREAFLAGFRDFCRTARIQDFCEHDHQVDVAGDTAVISFRYDMVYERARERYCATGRDLWVFQRQDGEWKAVWRTMLDMEEKSA